LAGPTRLELATSGVTGRRSNQLNYDPATGWHIIEKWARSFKTSAAAGPAGPLIAACSRKAYNSRGFGTLNGEGRRREIMRRMTRREKFQAKIGIQMDHLKAGLIELRAKAKEAKLDARQDFDKGLDALEKAQEELKCRLDEWAKAGKEAERDLKKTIKRSSKNLRKSVKKAYRSLT
jgi:Skp family chaperone for outer membrane proteins